MDSRFILPVLGVFLGLFGMKSIPNYEGVYSIEEDGRVWSHRRQKYLRPNPDGGGYLMLDFRIKRVRRSVKIHRLLAICFLGCKETDLVDHKDGNVQNNALSNLRVCDKAQNLANAKVYSNNTSGYKGVSWCAPRGNRRGYYKAQISDGCHIGSYQSAEEAAKAYDTEARLKYGEFARLNFPNG